MSSSMTIKVHNITLSLSLALILPDSGSICKGDNKQLISGKNNACLFTFFRIKWGIPNSLCPYFGQTLESQIRANMGLPAMVSSEIYLQWCLVQVGKGINHPYRLPFWQGGSLWNLEGLNNVILHVWGKTFLNVTCMFEGAISVDASVPQKM